MESDRSDALVTDVDQAARCCHSAPPVAQQIPSRLSQIGRWRFMRKDLAAKRPKATSGGWVASTERPVLRDRVQSGRPAARTGGCGREPHHAMACCPGCRRGCGRHASRPHVTPGGDVVWASEHPPAAPLGTTDRTSPPRAAVPSSHHLPSLGSPGTAVAPTASWCAWPARPSGLTPTSSIVTSRELVRSGLAGPPREVEHPCPSHVAGARVTSVARQTDS